MGLPPEVIPVVTFQSIALMLAALTWIRIWPGPG